MKKTYKSPSITTVELSAHLMGANVSNPSVNNYKSGGEEVVSASGWEE